MGLSLKNLKIIRNRKTNQLLVALPRKKLRLNKKVFPKSMNIGKIDFQFDDDE